MRRFAIGLLGGALAVAACGPGSDSGDGAAPADTPAPVTESAPETASDQAPPATTAAPATDQPPADELGDDVPAPEPDAEPAPDAEPTTTPAPGPAPAPVGGRELGTELRPESAEASNNPLPAIQVDDVRRGVQANLANVFPAERPVLVWAWAPH